VSLELSDLHRVVSLLSPTIHPSGEGGVVVHKTALDDGSGYCTRLLWVSPDARRFLTNGPKDDAPAFTEDGSELWFVRTADDLGRVYRLPMAGGEPTPVGPKWQGLSGVLPLGDGRAVVLAKRAVEAAPETVWPRHYRRWQWQFDGAGYFEVPTHLYLLSGDEDPVLLDDSPYDVGAPALSPDHRFVVYTRMADEDTARLPRPDLFRVDLDRPHDGPQRLTEGQLQAGAPAVAPDGTVFFFASDEAFGPATQGQMYRRTPEGAVARVEFGEEWAVGQPLSSDVHVGGGIARPKVVGDEVVGLATWRGRTMLWRRPLAAATAESPVPTTPSVVFEFDATAAPGGPALLYVGGSPDCFDTVYLRRGDEETVVADDNAWSREVISPLREAAVAAQDGLSIPIYVVGEQADAPRPAILHVHGGPHGAYGLVARFDAQVMARDYVVMQVNPRGSMGLGQAFADACRGDWGGGDMADLMAAVDALVEAGSVDATRLYVTGGSYGGFMTSWIVGHTDRFKAASAVVPVTNLVSFYGTSDIGWWFAPGEVGPDLWDDPKRLWEQSPLAYAPRITTPTQVMAGENDRRCPIEQAEQLYTALKRFDVDTEFLRYPGPHGFGSMAKPTLRQDRLRRLLEWFSAHP
jgi:dipeptidyl aminopeptidase/acylaminoacyl peptidase